MLVLQHRHINKLLGTFIQPYILASKVQAAYGLADRISCEWNQVCTGTGRLSSSNPNIQTLPKAKAESLADAMAPADDDDVDTVAEFLESERISIRGAFAARAGCVLLSADFSCMEMRICAFIAQDAKLLRIFESTADSANASLSATSSSPAADVYVLMAAAIFQKRAEAVSPSERAQAKTVTLGILYGMQPMALAARLGAITGVPCSVTHASSLQAKFLNEFPGIRNFIAQTVRDCRANQGFVQTIAGRRRNLPNIFSSDAGESKTAERQAVNSIIQGSAADLLKKAMFEINLQLFDFSAARPSQQSAARIVMSLHDEIIVEVVDDAATVDAVAAIVRECMENALPIPPAGSRAVQMDVQVKCGPTLDDLRSFKGGMAHLPQSASQSAAPASVRPPPLQSLANHRDQRPTASQSMVPPSSASVQSMPPMYQNMGDSQYASASGADNRPKFTITERAPVLPMHSAGGATRPLSSASTFSANPFGAFPSSIPAVSPFSALPLSTSVRYPSSTGGLSQVCGLSLLYQTTDTVLSFCIAGINRLNR